MSLSKLAQTQSKLEPDSERIAITYGDAGENHVGMEPVGELGEAGSGFTVQDLIKIKTFAEELGKKCDMIDLSDDRAVKMKNVKGKKVETQNKKEAAVLILRNFISSEQIKHIYDDLTSFKWDEKYWDTRRNKVLNKNARSNVVLLPGISQEPDYENKKGRIVDWNNLKNFKAISEMLFEIINTETEGKANNLIAEGNRYIKSKKMKKRVKKVANGIGWHGDAERRKVICMCIGGVEYCMKWQWFYNHKPLDFEPKEVFLNSGDVYIMSEEAVGQKWKQSSIYTLRHCAGPDSNSPFVQYKKSWIEYLNDKKNITEFKNDIMSNKKVKKNKKVRKKPQEVEVDNKIELDTIAAEVLASMLPTKPVVEEKVKKKVKKKLKKLKLKKSDKSKTKKVKEKIDLDNISVDSIPTLTADNFIVEEPENKKIEEKKVVELTMTEIIVPSDVKLPGEEILLGKTWKPTQNNSIVAEWRGQYTDRRIGEMRISILHPSNVELDLRWHDPMSRGEHMLDKKLFDKYDKIPYAGSIDGCSAMKYIKLPYVHWGVWSIKSKDVDIYNNSAVVFT